jgi:hypothetical protein
MNDQFFQTLGFRGFLLLLVFIGVWAFTDARHTPLMEWLEIAIPTKMLH